MAHIKTKLWLRSLDNFDTFLLFMAIAVEQRESELCPLRLLLSSLQSRRSERGTSLAHRRLRLAPMNTVGRHASCPMLRVYPAACAFVVSREIAQAMFTDT